MNVPSKLDSKARSALWRTIHRAAAGALMLVLTLLLTAGGAVHPLLHQDAGSPGHDCAFVHWANGETGLAQTGAAPLLRQPECRIQTFAPLWVDFFPAETLPYHSRGPPQG